ADFGVKVVVIEPGAVTTEMTGRLVIASERITSGMTAEQRGRYDALMQAVIAQAQTYTKAKGCPPRRPDESSPTRSSASGLALAIPSAATLRSSFASLDVPLTACWTACWPAPSNATSPKPCRRRERTTRASVFNTLPENMSSPLAR
ncbi:MAG TPA: hypothetical protein VEO55_02330, partial [Candidatus Dormibacteraeota bacterium]|nr:hypothetical protein [Candidatus Dormibacteraeota bacterium]